MKFSLRWLPLGTVVGLLACGGDGSSGSDGPGAGGVAGTGGVAGHGAGAGGSGGTTSAGTGGTAGASGKAGTSGVAGAAGASGTAGTGAGASGTAGQSGAAGTGAGAGAAGSNASGGSGQGGAAAGGGAGGSAGADTAGTAGMSAGGSTGAAGMSAGGAAGASAGAAGASAGAAGAPGPCDACQTGFVCKHDTCVPDLGKCKTNNDCPGDSYCDTDETCVPYGVPPTKTNDPTCKKASVPPTVTPVVQCEWTGPPADDPTAALVETYSTPVVVDLNLDGDPNKIQPSIILSTFDFNQFNRVGMLRVFDGRTCQEQMRIGGPDDPDAANNRSSYVGGWAVGDLDGDVGTKDGHPEIVGFHRIGLKDGADPLAVVAFGVDTSDPGKPKLVRRWFGRDCTGETPSKPGKPVEILNNAANFALGLYDLDNDGLPEVVIDRLVFDSKGCVLNPAEASKVTSYGKLGIINTVADADLDGVPELIHFDGVYGWDAKAKDWALKPWATASAALTEGNVAIADLGAFSEIPGHPKTDHLPEVIVTANGFARVQTLKGDIVFGPFQVPPSTSDPTKNRGGPPTAADFDGDGQVEFATAGAKFYTVFDPDCVPGADKSLRPGGMCSRPDPSVPDGVLWMQPSQDSSSNLTGSSVFDFNGDGKAEVIYRDECFVRVYEGATGEVIYSAPASSGTGYEYPVIVDVDGDFATEIVVPRTSADAKSCSGSTNADGSDKLFPASGSFKPSSGFVVYRDPEDRWVSSRPVWNQHAYYVTNVNDDGSIPKSSQVLPNWEQPGLNNFRQNTQGNLKATALADLTVELQNADQLCAGTAGTFTVSAQVCNRGTNPVQDGASVVFSQQVKGKTATKLCSAVTETLLAPSDCTVVSCSGTLGDNSDVLVSVDPQGKIADCHPGNNQGASARVLCGKP